MEKESTIQISIIVPIYNMEEYLSECIESILSQEYTDYELILVNDGSTDRSASLCENYARKDNRIIVIHQENKGLSEARNAGLERAKGNYISFIDSDDFIHCQMFKILYQNIIENNGDISVCNFHYTYPNKRYSKSTGSNKISILNNKEATLSIVQDSDLKMIVAWGKLYRRELFLNLRYPKGKYHEDEYITYQLFYQADTIVLSDAKLYYYRQRDNSITGSKYSLKRLDKLEALKESIEFFKLKKESTLEYLSRYRYVLNLQIAYYRIRSDRKEETGVLNWLKEEHREQLALLRGMKNQKRRIMDEMIIYLFHYFPKIYYLIAYIYLIIKR
ncbi:MAG TPA: capsular biosynthesis protein CpsJ [Lachnospiraceae bacterium]|jgi:glycosyltransferase involved in cell wall biosynthesis|nr:capsular biosynthesis protein CpsJ [Lachnospiraceae bacterium]